ncbi:uncharacterized protein [Zea mays]|uniref:uncharacterized protein isoform X2 n=1 Tax=Zea mays TaxID=4577 RepID=UPI001652154F|nr:uncharacterized protein LOC103647051 isoform X2 [Zea mays]
MDDQENEDQALEHILTDANAEPVMLSYAFLKSITNDFSCVIGRGGFGVVYKGYLHNGKTVAVKQLSKTDDFSEKQFHDELMCLIRVKHRNIVRFLGYCSDTQQKMADFNGRFVLADIRRRFLCFEFVPNKSLLHYLKEQSTGRDWKTRYQLIEGICQGLWYLHHEEHINHLDLKPENILLDDDMVPKISDFGLSRRFSGELNVIITENICGTLGYIAPEYLSKGEISFKADIFSLGIIIKKILMGSNDLSDFEKWHESQDVHCPQLNRCIQISQLCLEDDQHKRPTIGCIIDMLNDMKTTTTETIVSPGFGHSRNNSGSSEEYESCDSSHLPGIHHGEVHSATEASTCVSELLEQVQSLGVSTVPSSQLHRITSIPKGFGETNTHHIRSPGSTSESSKLLDVYPLELRFPLEPNKCTECPVTLTNRTDCYVGVWITPAKPHTCHGFYFSYLWWQFPSSSFFQIMDPHSTLVVTLVMDPLQLGLGLQDTEDKFQVLMIVMESQKDLENLNPSISSSTDNDMLRRVEELGGEVHRAILRAVSCDPASCKPEVVHSVPMVISAKTLENVLSIDVDLDMCWILASHRAGYVSIWNYNTQGRVTALKVTKEAGMLHSLTRTRSATTSCVYSAKFITRKKLFATGDGYGYICIYAYTMDKVKKFEAYHGKPVSLLAVHSTYPFLLSSSSCDRSIKLWAWDQQWACTRTFDAHTSGVQHVRFNPADVNTFVSVSCGGACVKVWEIHSSTPITTLFGPNNVDYFTDADRQFLLNIWSQKATILDLQTQKTVHRLLVHQREMRDVACHPTLPILATRLDDGTVCLWDATTYRYFICSCLFSRSHKNIILAFQQVNFLIIIYIRYL